MKRTDIFKFLLVPLLLGVWVLVPASAVMAQGKVKYGCSNQVYAAFSKEHIQAFTKATGASRSL